MNKKILKIDSSIRKNESYSRDLTNELVVRINNGGDYEVVTRDLSCGMDPITESWVLANNTPGDERDDSQRSLLLLSDALISELKESDIIVVGVPIYNFGIPAPLKMWIDQVTRSKVTFKYTDSGPVGLLENKKAYIVIASGGTRLKSDIDFVSDYIVHILGFLGVDDVTFIDSSGLGSGSSDVTEMAMNEIKKVS